MKITEISRQFLSKNHWVEAATIAAALIVSYGVKIANLGFYGGDWATVLSNNTSQLTDSWVDPIQTILINILGTNPIVYHDVILAFLFICGILLLGLLKDLGFDSASALAIVLLFLVYPGFYKPVEALPFIPVLVGLAAALIAFWIFRSWQKSEAAQYSRLALGIIFSAISLFTSPYSALVISTAFVFLLPGWREIHETKKRPTGILSFSLFVLGSVSIVFGYKSFVGPITSYFRLTVLDLLKAYIFSWRQIAAVPRGEINMIFYLSVLLLFGILLTYVLIKISKYGERENSENLNENKYLQIPAIIFSLIAGLIVIFLMNLSGNTGESVLEGRGGFVLGIYVSIFVVLCIDLLILAKYRLPVFVLLIILSVGTRYALVNRFTIETSRIEDMLAQLTVRGDYFKEGTVVVSEQLPFDFTTEASINALIQTNFSLNANKKNVQYLSANRDEIRDFLRGSDNQSDIQMGEEALIVSKENLIGFYYEEGECLQILDWTTDIAPLPNELKLVTEISHPELFIAGDLSDVKHLNQLSTKIEEAWCFYYQLANRQASNQEWAKVIGTFASAEENGLSPYAGRDYLVLLRAQIMENNFQEAIILSKEILEIYENKQKICDIWSEASAVMILDREVVSEIENARNTLVCP